MRKINGAYFYTGGELARILGYEEVEIGEFGVFCRKGKGAGKASRLESLAFLLCRRGMEEGLTAEEILWLVDGQIQRLEAVKYGTD